MIFGDIYASDCGSFLASLSYRVPNNYRREQHFWSMRDLAIYRSTDVVVNSEKRFTVQLPASSVLDSLSQHADFGANKIIRQLTVARSLARGSEVSAWCLISFYYSAFFAALELLRLSGTVIHFFDSDDIRQIASSATYSPSGKNLAKGSYVGTVQPVDTETVEIDFVLSQAQAHETVWQRFRQFFNRFKRHTTKSTFSTFCRMQACLGQSLETEWIAPNANRNKWNYRDDPLYAPQGDRLAKCAKAHSQDISKLIGWARKKIDDSQEAEAVGFVFLAEILALDHLEVVRRKLLPDAVTRKYFELISA